MESLHVGDVAWYIDSAAVAKGEPGLWNTYMASLGAVLRVLGEDYAPAWLMGASGWAFRINVHKDLCPSAISVFDWADQLTESVAQLGHGCTYVSRMWWEDELQSERQQRAHVAILEGLERGIPAISWDMSIPEWELIVGYDAVARVYEFISCTGELGTLPCEKLGNRGTDPSLLSVTVVGEPNGRSRKEVVRRSLQIAVDHASERERMELPDYVNGLPAYTQWANTIEPDYEGSVNWDWSAYYAAQWVGARCYARDYLRLLIGEYPALADAAETYAHLAKELLPIWQAFSTEKCPPEEVRIALAGRLRRAGELERRGVRQLEAFLLE